MGWLEFSANYRVFISEANPKLNAFETLQNSWLIAATILRRNTEIDSRHPESRKTDSKPANCLLDAAWLGKKSVGKFPFRVCCC